MHVTPEDSYMSRKDFTSLASMVYHMRGTVPEEYRVLFANELARELQNIANRFDKQKFLFACGV